MGYWVINGFLIAYNVQSLESCILKNELICQTVRKLFLSHILLNTITDVKQLFSVVWQGVI